MSAMMPFDVTGPIPTGTTLLEASAGTGKTYTVGALVTRALAEGLVTMDELLVITFTRAASHELRERVRRQLVDALGALDAAEPPRGERFLEFLWDVDEDTRAERRERLRDALTDFDAATISTTHQFCQLVLRSLGVAGDLDPGAALVESLDDLIEEVVDDLYLSRFGWAEGRPPFGRPAALSIAREVINDPHSVIAAPADPATWSPKVRFAHDVRAEVERRKRLAGVLSYDDLLSRLADALDESTGEPLAKRRMADRWRMVLVDEFQDTDPVQWQVLTRAFGDSATLILIGDPKQAIYGFRGGDVVAYLQGAAAANRHATLAHNYRSDPELVRRLGAVFSGAALGDDRIIAHPTEPALTTPRLTGAPSAEPLRLRVVARGGLKRNRDGSMAAAVAREFVARDCAGDIAALLSSGARFADSGGDRPLVAADIAVLVANRNHGQVIAQALAERGIPSVVAGAGQVMQTRAAAEWMTLLDALEQPHHTGRVRAAALTSLVGLSVGELDAGGERLTDTLCEQTREWASLARQRGIGGLFAQLDERGVSQRVLASADGPRHLTDLRHLAETLHELGVRDGLGLTALTAWLRAERRDDAGPSERIRRLDTDSAAVQILTIHGAKGLQFPVVYVPFAFDNFRHAVTVARYHDDAGRRMIGLEAAQDDWQEQVSRHLAEEAGEELRQLYVALTRGQSQVVTWWAPSSNAKTSALHRMLWGRTPGQREVPTEARLTDDAKAWAIAEQWAALGGPACERAEIQTAPFAEPEANPDELTARSFERAIDVRWRRTSYSGLIRAEEALPGVGSEPVPGGKDDETGPIEVGSVSAPQPEGPPGPLVEETEDRLDADALSPMADLPAGATFGSLVHAVLEEVDPAAPELEVALAEVATDQLRWWPVAASPEQLAAALAAVIRTPLGPLAQQATLADLGVRNRLCELEFEFPLAGGDDPIAEIWLGELAQLLEEHVPADDVLRPYAARLRAPGLATQALRGYLSGSIDVVLRTADSRYLVVDYKTNRLGAVGEPMRVEDYAPSALADAMVHSHYPLQALLYSVVLHRFLRWRLPDYDPAHHLGGVLYLYVRGMAGPETPVIDGTPCGVFAWQPPVALVEAMSDWLAGGRP